jgi:hypothetical protein
MSLFLNHHLVNKNKGRQQIGTSTVRVGPFFRFIFAEKFLAIFNETDGDNYGRAHQPGKEHYFQRSHYKDSQYHKQIVTCFQTAHSVFTAECLS